MTMNYTGERAIPWNASVGVNVMTHHIKRYAWATPHVWQKSVVDLGCGAGYGAYLLSWVARSVVGVDAYFQTIAYAQATFAADNLHYEWGNISEGVPSAEVYTAFEVIEHLDDPLPLLESVDEAGGSLVWSIPINSKTQWHKQVYDVAGIKRLMGGSHWWYQGNGGQIAPESLAWFDPVYVLGVRS